MLLNLRITSGNDLKTKLPQYSAKTMSSSLWTTEANGYLTFCVSVAFLYSVIFCFFNCDFREKLNVLESRKNRKMYLTTALHSWQRYSKELAEKVSRSLDWINIMTYDMGGGIWGNVPTHNTPLDRIITDLKAWEMFDKSKLCIGLANYGFFYKGIKPGQKIEGKLDKYGRYIGYNEAMAVFSSDWKEVKDPQAKVSYFINEKQQEFITLETKETIRTKAEWVKENGFRGAFWWEFSYDEILPDSKDGKIRHHLIDEIKW